MDGRFDLNAAIVIVVPFVLERDQFLAGREGVKAEIIAQEHGRAAGNIGFDSGLCHSLANLVAEVIHIRHARRAEAQRLGKRKRRGRLDGAAVEPVLARGKYSAAASPANSDHRHSRAAGTSAGVYGS